MIKHPLADCDNCPLNEIGAYTPTKFPTGIDYLEGEHPEYAVVGEAPGYQEAMRGEPFVGPSGKLLDRVLSYHGLDRKEMILTNAASCRPPDNATPPAAAVKCCEKRLHSDLAGVKRILALGNTAAQTLLATKQGITQLRIGPRRPSPLFEGVEIVPTIHPAACLRQGDRFPDLVTDVGKLNKHHTPWAEPTYVVVDDEERALDAIDQLGELTDKVVVDIETGIDKDNSFDHPNRYQMLCVGIAYAKGKCCIIGEEAMKVESVREALKQLLRQTKIIAHNGKFDLGGLYPVLGDIRLWFDTMLAHYVIDERPGGHGLKTLGVEELGTPQWEHEIQKYIAGGKSYANIPRPILYKYCAFDCAVEWELYEEYSEKLEQPTIKTPFTLPRFQKLRDVHDFLIEASNELKFPELNGITVDKVYSQQLSMEYLGILSEMEERLDSYVAKDYDKKGGINPRSPKQVKEFLADNKIMVKSTDADTLEILQKRLIPDSNVGKFVSLLLEHRRKAKLHGTYIKGIRNRTYRGRVYTTYLLHGTTSGRLASRNPNLQNIVRDKGIRRQFTVSKEGNIFCHADFKQAEGRVITTLAQEPYLRDIFSDADVDLFNSLSDQLYGVGNWAKEQRIRTKAYFYGLSYGREAYSIAQEYGMSVREAEKGLRDFFDLIPNVAKWQNRVKQQILDGKDLVTPFGRSRRFMLITKENRDDVLKEGLSFLPQSTASDICLSALIVLRPKLRGKAFLRLTIHDALMWECKEEDKDEVTQIVTDEMLRQGALFTDYVPFGTDVTFGTSWGSL